MATSALSSTRSEDLAKKYEILKPLANKFIPPEDGRYASVQGQLGRMEELLELPEAEFSSANRAEFQRLTANVKGVLRANIKNYWKDENVTLRDEIITHYQVAAVAAVAGAAVVGCIPGAREIAGTFAAKSVATSATAVALLSACERNADGDEGSGGAGGEGGNGGEVEAAAEPNTCPAGEGLTLVELDVAVDDEHSLYFSVANEDAEDDNFQLRHSTQQIAFARAQLIQAEPLNEPRCAARWDGVNEDGTVYELCQNISHNVSPTDGSFYDEVRTSLSRFNAEGARQLLVTVGPSPERFDDEEEPIPNTMTRIAFYDAQGEVLGGRASTKEELAELWRANEHSCEPLLAQDEPDPVEDPAGICDDDEWLAPLSFRGGSFPQNLFEMDLNPNGRTALVSYQLSGNLLFSRQNFTRDNQPMLGYDLSFTGRQGDGSEYRLALRAREGVISAIALFNDLNQTMVRVENPLNDQASIQFNAGASRVEGRLVEEGCLSR